jgi:hypothetical protein
VKDPNADTEGRASVAALLEQIKKNHGHSPATRAFERYILEAGLSLSAAAREEGIPETTLRDLVERIRRNYTDLD